MILQVTAVELTYTDAINDLLKDSESLPQQSTARKPQDLKIGRNPDVSLLHKPCLPALCTVAEVHLTFYCALSDKIGCLGALPFGCS